MSGARLGAVKPEEIVLDAVGSAEGLIASFLKLADRRGFVEIRAPEVVELARDLGYRSSRWAHGDALHWLASNLATAGRHPSMPGFRFKDGFVDPAQVGPDYLCASLNALLRAALTPGSTTGGTPAAGVG